MELVLHDLRKLFSAGGDQFVALDGVDLHIPDGQFVSVMGSNGAGKSTMLNAVAGSVFQDSGEIHVGDTDVSAMAEHRRARLIARVFQDPRVGTAPDLTVAENFALAALRTGRRSLRRGVTRQLRKDVTERFRSCGFDALGERLDQTVGTLSGGQRQGVSLLMATWERPGILLLDEHTAALDPERAESIMTLTQRLQEEMSLTILMVTHNPQHAVKYGHRLLIMHQGQIVDDVSGDEKQNLTFDRLLERFAQRGMSVDDRALLTDDDTNATSTAPTSEASLPPATPTERQ